MIDRDEFSAWLRLLETPGVGRESARALLGRFGSAGGGDRRLDRRRARQWSPPLSPRRSRSAAG